MAAPEAAQLELSGTDRHVPPEITDKLSLLVNYRVKLTGTSREEYAGSIIPALKSDGSPAPSSRPSGLLVCPARLTRFLANSCAFSCRAMPGPALRVDLAAQAQHYGRAVPGTGTMLAGPGRAWAMLFRAVPGPPHRVSAK